MKKILLLNDSKKGVLNLPEFKNHKIKIYRSDNFQEACGIMLHDYIDLFIIDTVATDSDGDSVGGIRFAEAIRRVQQYCFTPIIFFVIFRRSQVIYVRAVTLLCIYGKALR